MDLERNCHILLKHIAVVGTIALFIQSAGLAVAIDTSKNNFLGGRYYNSLIADSDFIDINSMSPSSIQDYLVGRNSALKDVSEGGRSAAQIIYDAAHGYNEASGTLNGIVINTSTGTVSPKTILVTLQKEQSLVTLTPTDRDTNPDSYNNRLNRAMGYACPDGSSCNPSYSGFTKQVEWASWQLRYNYERAQGHGFSDYQVNQTTSFSDYTGSYSVTFANRSTAALYRYTPHVFNGNYNFWKLFNEYFGGTPAPPPPPSTDDSSPVSGKTYGDRFKVTGSKAQASRVFFDGREIAGSDATTWSLEFQPSIGNKVYTIEYKDPAGNVIASKQINVDRHKTADINGDARVDLIDLSLLSDQWGRGVPDGDWTNLNPDVDSDINILDLSIMSTHWEG